MTGAVSKVDVRTAFRKEDYDCDDDNVWESAAQLGNSLGLGPAALVEEYELYICQRTKRSGQRFQEQLSPQIFAGFQDHLKKKRSKENHAVVENRTYSLPEWTTTISTPTSGSKAAPRAAAPTPSPIAVPHAAHVEDASPAAIDVLTDRSADAVVGPGPYSIATHSTLHPDVKVLPSQDRIQPLPVTLLGPPLHHNTRVLGNTLTARAAALEARILAFEAAMAGLLNKEISPTHAASQEDVVAVGRVCSDSPGVRPLPTSLFLEGSRKTSQGARVKLDLVHLKDFSLFPGQVVCVRGRNPSGAVLCPFELLDSLPRAPCERAEPCAGEPQQLRVVVASGPFTEPGDLAFRPLQALLEHCAGAPPALLLLCGPFIPDSHSKLMQATTTFEDIFSKQVESRAAAWAQQHPGTVVALMPAVSDAHHIPAHPQPPFKASGADPSRTLLLLPSPCCLRVAGVTISASSAEVLLDVSAMEISKHDGPWDRMGRLFQHVLSQQCMYPLFPPACGACVDFSLADHLRMPAAPDLLILPSDLAPTAKVVTSPAGGAAGSTRAAAVCVNPGRTSKGRAGTFAEIVLDVGSGSDAENVSRRCRVDIMRLSLPA